jgi:sugar lactone lactonase YvrE
MAFGPDGTLWIVDGNLGVLLHVLADGTLADVTSGMLGPAGVTVTPDGTVYVSDRGNWRIVSYNGHGGLDVVAGDSHFSGSSGDGGAFGHALFAQPLDLTSDAAGNLYIDDAFNQKIRWVDVETNVIDRLAGTGTAGFSGDGGPALEAEISTPQAIAVDVDGTELLIADSANVRLRRVDLITGQIDTIAGTGGGSVSYDPTLKGSTLPLGRIAAVAVDGGGNIYLPVFWGNMGLTLMRLDATDALTLLAGGGAGGPGSPPLQFALPDVLCIVPNPQTGDLLLCGSDGKIYNVPGAGTAAGP